MKKQIKNELSLSQSHFVLYTSESGKVKVEVEVFFKDETVWLTQKAIAELFDVLI